MIIILAVAGAVLGLFFLDGFFQGAWMGAAVGALAGWVLQVSKRLAVIGTRAAETEERLLRLQEFVERTAGKTEPKVAEPEPTPAPTPAGKPVEERPSPAVDKPLAPPPSALEPAPKPATTDVSVPGRAAARSVKMPPVSEPLRPGIPEQALDGIKRWFTMGNVPVKVGVIVSLFGVAFLILEAVDRGWLVFPLELRLLSAALFGLVLLVIGWRLRTRRPGYALSVQGGGIAIIYLTTYAAFALYHLLPAVPAFALLVVVTAAAGTLAVLQDSRALAVLGITGGFMAPVLTSTGAGNHVVLFSYYAILNAAVLGISWFKAWRLLNVLGFLFTFVVGTAWGYLAYNPDQFATTEPFLILFVIMYTVIPVLFASQKTPTLSGWVDGTLVFGTPIAGFGLQTQLVGDTEYGLAISAVALAGLYVAIATYLFRKKSPPLRVLTESFWSLSIVFLALAVPLALNARWTSVAWSLQGAAMVWLGMRQNRKLALAAGIALQLGAAIAYTLQPGLVGDEIAVWNGHYLGALLVALTALFSSGVFDRMLTAKGRKIDLIGTWGLLVWGTAWWIAAGLNEIDRFVPSRIELSASLTFVAASVWAAVLVAKQFRFPRLDSLGLLLIPAMAFAFLLGLFGQPHPLADYGWLAWPAAAATHFGFLRLRENYFDQLKVPLHAAGYWLLTGVIASEAHWWIDRYTAGVWSTAAAIAIVAGLILTTLRSRGRLAWPVAAHWPIYLFACAGVTLGGLVIATVYLNVVSPGNPQPLPYIALLNPLELATIFVVLVSYYWFAAAREHRPIDWPGDGKSIVLPVIVGLFLLTMTVARTVHHWADVPFDPTSLAASNVLQASLSIVWGSTALAGMVFGALRAHRTIWMAGATLMAVVVIKLFLVELGSTGTVARVVSFLGVGILLLIVGYFAPAPPHDSDKAATA